MRLSKIKLAGFKSFVDPTTIDLVSNLTAVVGPNGCGKSNIIDAIRWVMGESSAKNLRGGASTDVIFNGSSGRKPIGQASVELVFDNSDGSLGGEYAAFSEICIKRQVTRDGQSSYFLNGQRARRKDITGIFLGTGLGPRSYAIIEQGMISRVIEAKPEDMRNFIEEASGVSKYKERRRETENRIRHTHDNLNRVNDLRAELEKQLNNLERQAETAQKYKTLKQEERVVEAELVAMSWQRLQTDIENSEGRIRELTTLLEKHHAEITHFKAEMETAREVQADKHDALNDVQKQYYAIGTDIATIEQSLENLKNNLKMLEANKAEEQNTLAQATQGLSQDKTQIVELESALEEQLPIKLELVEKVANLSAQFETSEEALESWREISQELQADLHKTTQNAEKCKTSIQLLEKQVQMGDVRYQKLKVELDNLGQPEDINLQMLEQQLESLDNELYSAQNNLTDYKQTQAQLKQAITNYRQDIKQKSHERQQVKDRLTALEAVQAVKLGKGQTKENQWIAQKGLDNAQHFGEVIQVESKWQLAIETLLAPQFEAIYLANQQLADLIQDAQPDELHGLHIMSLDSCELDIHPSSILSKVLNPEVLNTHIKHTLNRIFVCESLKDGMQYLENASQKESSFITPGGIWLGSGWIKVPAKSDSDEYSILKTREQIDALSQQINELDLAFEALEAQLEHAENDQQEIEQTISNESEQLSLYKQQHSQLESDIRLKKNKIEQFEIRTDRIKQEMNELSLQNTSQNELIATTRDELQTHLEKMGQLHEKVESHNQDKDLLVETRRNFKLNLEESKDELHELALSVQAKESALTAVKQSINRFDEQIQHSADKLQRIEQSILEATTPQADIEKNLQLALDKRIEAEEQLNTARDDVQNSENILRQIEHQMQDVQNNIESVRDQLEYKKMQWQAAKVHLESAQNKITQLEISAEDILRQLSEGANEDEWANRLEQISKQIAKLGAINLTAIDEYSAAKERKVYLDNQCDDLNEALSTLEQAIQKIDQETRDRFQETFDKINNGFQSLFPRLFGGGESSMVLTDEDILSAGVSVMARPPGKKNASIHQLSGGEKALTAVAFVFSIFLLNPAPFCLLDEVDAPLDDSNVGRFVRLVKEMAETVQFIFISHNKIAIEMGEQLHGVTMREPGVSRLVSVDIDEAVDMAMA